MMTKAECRKYIKTLMGEHGQELPARSEKALAALRENEHFRSAKTVLLFHSLKDEVATHDFLHEVAKPSVCFFPWCVARNYLWQSLWQMSISKQVRLV